MTTATEITPNQREALAASGDFVECIDPRTNEVFVLLRAEYFERIKDLLDLRDLTERERTAIIQDMGKSVGWEEPGADDLI